MIQAIVICVFVAVISAVIASVVSVKRYKATSEQKIGNADVKAREIIDEALKTAETKKREALLEAKEETLRMKNESEREIKESRAEVQRYERRILAKEEQLDKKAIAMEKREVNFANKEERLAKKVAEIDELYEKRVQELERISGLTSEQAKEYLLKAVEDEVKTDAAKLVRELENKAKEEASKKAKDYVVTDLSIDEITYIATEFSKYEFGNIYSPEGTVDTTRMYERYYLNIDEFEKMIIEIFYEQVE